VATKSRKGRPLKPANERATRRLAVNLNQADYERLMRDYDATIYPKKSMYYRARMIDQAVTVRHRNQSLEDAIPTLVAHNEELRKIGINLNQMVRHLNTYKSPALKSEVLKLLLLVQQSTKIQDESKTILHEINHKWLSE
jgi:hypothetical protein